MDAVSLSNSPAAISIAAGSSNVLTPITAAPPGAPPSPAEIVPTAFSRNINRFNALTSTVLDTSGKHSDDDRLKAYSSLFEMGVKGQLADMDDDNRKLYDGAIMDSDIGKKAAKIQQQDLDTITSAHARGESTAAAKLKFVAGLSDSDQKTYFAVNENGFDLAGNRQYADLDGYRDQLVTDAGKADPKGLGQALKDVNSATDGGSWSTQVLSRLSSNTLASSDSSTMTSAGHTSAQPKMPLSYQPGNIFTRVV